LEFLLAEALNKGHKEVITVGGIQSNHCRATCISCRRVGLNPSVVLGTTTEASNLPIEGNIIFNKFVGANIYTVPRGMTRSEIFGEKTLELGAYPIPVGGSNRLGTWGYIQKWDEWVNDGLLQVKRNIFIPVGSGGTAAGLIIGNFLTGNQHNLHLLQVADTVDSLTDDIKSILASFSSDKTPLDAEEVMKNVTMHEAVGEGYAISTNEELEFVQRIATETGLIFDRVYSGKALRKSIELIRENQFENCMFLHTGGIHSISDSTMTTFLKN